MSKEYMRREVERFIDRCKLITDCTVQGNLKTSWMGILEG